MLAHFPSNSDTPASQSRELSPGPKAGRREVDVMLSKVLQGDVRPNAVLLGGLLNIAAELRPLVGAWGLAGGKGGKW